jgi:hypothetical protein
MPMPRLLRFLAAPTGSPGQAVRPDSYGKRAPWQ